LLWGIVCAVIALIAFAFSFPSKPLLQPNEKKQKKPRQDEKEVLISHLKSQVSVLNEELDKSRAESAAVKNELEILKKSESELKQELSRRKQWEERELTELEKVKKENAFLKEKLISKDKELEEEFSRNFNLDKELKEKKQKLELLEKDNRNMVETIRDLKAQISGYSREIEEQKKVIAELKKKTEESEWISKKEYNQLKRRLEEKEAELKKLQGGGEVSGG